jgi:hypothetical protein
MSLTREQHQHRLKVLADCDGNKSQAARLLGINEKCMRDSLKTAAKLGLSGFQPVQEGFEISRISSGPHGDYVTQRPEHGEVYAAPPEYAMGKVTLNLDADGRVIQSWPRYLPGAEAQFKLVEHLKHAFDDYVSPHAPVMAPLYPETDFCNLIPTNDWHVNLLAWWREVGTSWDLKIAERTIGNAISTAIARSRMASLGIVLGGGDLLHNDDNTNRTAKSHNVLDADGRHTKGLEVAERLMVLTIDAALAHNSHVVVRILKGNHDEHSSVTVSHFLRAYYRTEPRVTVDCDESLFWFYEFGDVMLAATHGHTIKIQELPAIMAHRRAQMWGRTKHRYAHGFHVHHKSSWKVGDTIGGVACETHEAPIPLDGWHYGCGYMSGRSVKVITYHKRLGYYTEQREPIDDAGDESGQELRMAA